MARKKTTTAALIAMLSSKIQPFFQQGKLALATSGLSATNPSSETVHLEELPRPTNYEIMTHAPRPLKYLNSPALNIHKEYIGNTNFNKALNGAEYDVNECFEIRVAQLKYYRLYKALTQGLISKKVYAAIGTKQPINITHNGKTFPVSFLDIRVFLPERVCKELEHRYVGKYPDHTRLKLRVKGPANLCGGYDEGGFMKFYCLDYYLEVYAEDYQVELVR